MTQFKENMIFQMFKDKCIGTAQKFKKEMKDKYNIDNVRDVYIKIVNYQVEKYGEQLRSGTTITYIDNFKYYSRNGRKYRKMRDNLNNGTNRIIERNEV